VVQIRTSEEGIHLVPHFITLIDRELPAGLLMKNNNYANRFPGVREKAAMPFDELLGCMSLLALGIRPSATRH